MSICFLVFILWIIAAIPTTNPILAIFAPVIVPITNPLSCFIEANIDETSSGREVPIATNVNPITNSDIPNFFAMDDAELTKYPDPFTRSTRPIRSSNILIIISL